MQANPSEVALATLVYACNRETPMSNEELRAWQKRMGLSGRGAARALGMNAATYLDRANGKSHTTGLPVSVSRALTLACAALEAARMLQPPPPGKPKRRHQGWRAFNSRSAASEAWPAHAIACESDTAASINSCSISASVQLFPARRCCAIPSGNIAASSGGRDCSKNVWSPACP